MQLHWFEYCRPPAAVVWGQTEKVVEAFSRNSWRYSKESMEVVSIRLLDKVCSQMIVRLVQMGMEMLIVRKLRLAPVSRLLNGL